MAEATNGRAGDSEAASASEEQYEWNPPLRIGARVFSQLNCYFDFTLSPTGETSWNGRLHCGQEQGFSLGWPAILILHVAWLGRRLGVEASTADKRKEQESSLSWVAISILKLARPGRRPTAP